MSFNLATMLEESAAAAPERPLLRLPDRTLSYREVEQESARVASGLLALGHEPGDRVGVQLPNVAEFVTAYFGVLKAGLTLVPLNPLLTAPEITYLLTDCQVRTLITGDAALSAATQAADEVGGVRLVTVGTPTARTSFAELAAAPPLAVSHATASDDTAVVLYTSGTTGRPKGAQLTHFQLFMNCTVGGELFDVTADDVMIGVLPLFHVFGLSSVLNIAVRYGASVALLPRFDVEAVLETIDHERATVFSGVPTMYVALAEADTTGRDTSSLRTAVSGGASMPAEVLRAFETRFDGIAVLEGYGLSETASVASFNISAAERKVLSIGKPVWGVQMRVVDPEGTELPPGPEHIGEVVIRGHNVMKGYHDNPEATAQAIRDGWFHTGDLGYRDEEGYFFIVDRLKDLIVRGGYNVYPREIEEVLYAHPAVAEAAVIGHPDARLGEEVHAYVALRPDQEATATEIQAFCRERLAAYKYPREVHLLDELPKGATGKLLKRRLRT